MFPKRLPIRQIRQKPHKTSWEPVADWYGRYMSLGNTVQKQVVFPNTLKLLNPKKDGRYLDIACGEGAFSRQLANVAHVVVSGVDISPSLIRQAQARAPKSAKYLVADATDFAKHFSPPFDGATCLLAIQNIEVFQTVFSEAFKVLKPGSPFILVMNHPSFRQPRQSGWGFDEGRKLQYRRVDRYLSSYDVPILAHPGSSPDVKTFSYHRPLQAYASALTAAGFVIDGLEEWVSDKVSKPGARAKAENAAREEIPMFLAIRAKKLV